MKKGKSRDGKQKKNVDTVHAKCKNRLQEKIKINIDEYKRGRFVSPPQAVAVSYSQIRKNFPECRKYFEKRSDGKINKKKKKKSRKRSSV